MLASISKPIRRLSESVRDIETHEYRAPVADIDRMGNISIDTVAESIGMISFYFSRLFRASYNKTFLEYLTDYRMERACQLLASTGLSVREISAAVGYSDPGYFTKVFRRHTGQMPTDYRLPD